MVQFVLETKGRLSLELDGIIDGKADREAIARAERRILELFPVNIWNVNVPGNMETAMEVGFRKFLFAVSEHTNQSMEEISTFDFYALLDHIKEKHSSGRSDHKI